MQGALTILPAEEQTDTAVAGALNVALKDERVDVTVAVFGTQTTTPGDQQEGVLLSVNPETVLAGERESTGVSGDQKEAVSLSVNPEAELESVAVAETLAVIFGGG